MLLLEDLPLDILKAIGLHLSYEDLVHYWSLNRKLWMIRDDPNFFLCKLHRDFPEALTYHVDPNLYHSYYRQQVAIRLGETIQDLRYNSGPYTLEIKSVQQQIQDLREKERLLLKKRAHWKTNETILVRQKRQRLQEGLSKVIEPPPEMYYHRIRQPISVRSYRTMVGLIDFLKERLERPLQAGHLIGLYFSEQSETPDKLIYIYFDTNKLYLDFEESGRLYHTTRIKRNKPTITKVCYGLPNFYLAKKMGRMKSDQIRELYGFDFNVQFSPNIKEWCRQIYPSLFSS